MHQFQFPALVSEDFFDRFMGPAAFLLWTGDTVKVIRSNRAYCKELELDCVISEDVDLLSTIDAQDRDLYRNTVIRVAETGNEQYCESIRHIFSQLCGAAEVYVNTRLAFVENREDGALLFAQVRNITEQKELACTIDSDRRFRYAAEQANMYAWEYTIASKQMRPCFRCMRDLGLPALLENYPEPAIEMGIFPQDYADMYRDWHRQLAEGVDKLEAIIPLTPARVPFHVRYSLVLDGEGKPLKAYGSATQVVDFEKEQEYKDIIGCLSKAYFALYYADLTTGEFYELTKAGMQATEDVIGHKGNARDAFLRMSKSLVVPEQAEEILRFTEYTTVSERLAHRDAIGIHFLGAHAGWCEGVFIAAKRNVEGVCTHAIWGVRSIQQQKAKEEQQKLALEKALAQTEEALDEAKRANSARNAFLSRMSHDIRTPLNGIIGLIEMSDRHAADIELLRSNRAKERIAAGHLLSLINDVLELSKMDDRNVRLADDPFDVRILASEVGTISSLRAAEKGVTVLRPNFSVMDQCPYLFGSPLHVKQLLLNIIGNAIKYNRPGGTVSCSFSLDWLSEDKVCYTTVITDTGIGMSPEFLEHVYEPFSQERTDARSVFQGTGLGMAIVKSLVDKMGGSIHVESEQNKGTTFTVKLPFRVAEKKDMPEIKQRSSVNVTGAKVLVAEDNELNMEIIVSLLEEMGVEITQAVNGREAVNIYASKAPGSFDLILMDLMMPVLDGYGATAEIRAMEPPYSSIPIVAMTANAFEDDVRECIAKGMNGHLAKPLDIHKLLTVIAEYKK